MSMVDKIKELAASFNDEMIAVRRHLHANPELSFKEHNTSKFIANQLDKIGIPYESGIVDTGIVAVIKGQNPESKCIALRGDMDALPIQEKNDVDYKSKNEGVMHACGHDVHTTSLLGAGKILNDLKDEFNGTIKLIFQPGEERLPGGASLMIKEGVLENPKPENMFAQHVFPELEVGKVGFRAGMYMASADELYVTVSGKGGHGALPHQVVDPVLISAHIITGLQQIVSRKAKPNVPTVLTFGKIIGEGSTNIVPDEVKLEGTFRTMDEPWRQEAHKLMVKMASGIAESMGGTCDFRVEKGYPYLVNDENTTAMAQQAAVEYLGASNVIDLELRMTAEDFSYFSQEAPSCFYRLGVRNESKGIVSNLHTATFNVDEACLEIGMGLMAYLAYKKLTS